MSSIPIIDGHIDLAWNKINLGRHFQDSVNIKRLLEPVAVTSIEGKAAVGYPEVVKANIRILLSTIWVETDKSIFPSLGKKYHDLLEARSYAIEQYEYYQSLCKTQKFSFVVNSLQLTSVLESSGYQFGIVPIIEGADFIKSGEDLTEWREKGIRIIAPVWQKNHFGGCSELGGGLSKQGRKLLKCMSKYNMVVDIAHMSDMSILETFDCFNGRVINTHTTCRSFVDDERLISDEQIVEIGKRKGIIGLMTWDKKIKKSSSVTIDDFIDHIDHIIELIGNTDCVGIGSSMDGGYGTDSLPLGMKDISSLSLLEQRLSRRGYSKIDIEKILYKNWYRVLLDVFKA